MAEAGRLYRTARAVPHSLLGMAKPYQPCYLLALAHAQSGNGNKVTLAARHVFRRSRAKQIVAQDRGPIQTLFPSHLKTHR